MAVNSYLLDFTIGEEAVGSPELCHTAVDAAEHVLRSYFPGLRRETVVNLKEGLLLILVAGDVVISCRTYKEGILTVNIEHYKSDSEEPLLPLEQVRALEVALAKVVTATRSKHLPPVKRARAIDNYLTTSDERILEYDIDRVVFEGQSPYQKIQILHSKSLGNMLVLDDLQNMSESDLIYSEMLMQRGIENYENKEIVILGGGDGCLLWELLKEKPKFVTMLELDEMVMKACRQFLRSSCGTCLDQYEGDNYEIIVGDCFKTIDKFISEGRRVDFVFGDLTDIPVDSSGVKGEAWEFIREILEKSMKIIKPGGKYLTHGNGSSAPKSLQAFENLLKSLKVPVDFTKTHSFIPSFLEDWVFYQVTPRFT